MRLSTKQIYDLESIMYFIPKTIEHIEITHEDVKMFFEYSDKGLHKEKTGTFVLLPKELQNGFNALIEGKKWRGINMMMYEEGVLDGTMPYYTLLGGYDGTRKRKWYELWKPKYVHYHIPMPRSVVDFMEKEMFKGKDAELIEKVYQQLIK